MIEPNAKEPRDIFDRLMHLPGLRILEPFYRAHKEALLYLFFGGVTTLINLIVFWLCESILGLDPLIANPISWAVAVLAAFLTNRIWVFHSHTSGAWEFFLQLVTFYAGRTTTLFVEEGILFVFVTLLALPAFPVKIGASVIVVILNFFLSKLLIFRKR